MEMPMKKLSKTFNTRHGQVELEIKLGRDKSKPKAPRKSKREVDAEFRDFMSGYYDNIQALVKEADGKLEGLRQQMPGTDIPTTAQMISISSKNYFPRKEEVLNANERALRFLDGATMAFANGGGDGRLRKPAELMKCLLPKGDVSPDLKKRLQKVGLDVVAALVDEKEKASAGTKLSNPTL